MVLCLCEIFVFRGCVVDMRGLLCVVMQCVAE